MYDNKKMTCSEITHYTWKEKYAHPGEKDLEDTFRRVSGFASKNDPDYFDEFYQILSQKLFIPGGRIISSAGTDRPKASLSNCFFVDTIPDSMDGIFSLLHESALIMQAGGGIGIDFSSLRPKGSYVKGTGSTSSGPVSFAQTWDAMCSNIAAAGSRRGAMMGIMRVDHPDIDLFITAKKKDVSGENQLKNFNLSVAVTDSFIHAVRNDLDWNLIHNGRVYKTVRAAELWDTIMRSNYHDWEPGVLFIDRINKNNNLFYCENVFGTNPCGEQPLPPYNSCNLGSVALPFFVKNPFLDICSFNFERFKNVVKTAVRFMDNILDLNYYPLEKIREESLSKRRIGLGILGLTDALSMMKLRYASDEGIEIAAKIMRHLRDTAYEASVELAKERGAFERFERDKYLDGLFIKALPEKIQEGIFRYGMRNSHLVTIAPTGTTSMFCGNMSSGIEPFFGIEYERSIRVGVDGDKIKVSISPYSVEYYRALTGETLLPDYILENITNKVPYKSQIKMQGALQSFIDASISKTITFPEDISYEDFKEAYLYAYELGCKGCTTYRPNSGRKGIIQTKESTSEITVPDLPAVPDVLNARRYKVKLPESVHAYYINISDIEDNGKKRPFEIFINTKDPQNNEWTTALTRLISAIFRRQGDTLFIAEELMEIQSQKTGFWNPKRRKFVKSLVAEIGETIRDHFVHLGLDDSVPVEAYEQSGSSEIKYAYCRKCGKDTLVLSEGCEFCINPKCNYNRCG